MSCREGTVPNLDGHLVEATLMTEDAFKSSSDNAIEEFQMVQVRPDVKAHL